MPKKEYKYYAFISYKREDESWAKWLQDRMEHYKLPIANTENNIEYLRPVFRDITDLCPGFLSERIKEALDDSKYLIAICSPRYSKSKWCDSEIKRFIETGKSKQIIPFIIDGTPYSDNEECFPPSLKSLRGSEYELLGADVRPISRDYAFIQVIASMLDVSVDTLWKRHLRKEEEERLRIKEENDRLLALQSRITAEKALELIIEWPFDKKKAAKLALEVLPKNLDYPERPWVPEAELILRLFLNKELSQVTIQDKGWIKCYSDKYCVCKGISGPKLPGKIPSIDYSIRLYDKSSELIETLDYKEFVDDVCISSDNHFIGVATKNHIYIHYLNCSLEDIVLEAKNSFEKIIKVSPDNRFVACVSGDSGVLLTVFDTKNNSTTTINCHSKKVMSLEFSPESKKIVTSSLDGLTKIWNISDLNSPIVIKNVSTPTYSVFSQDGNIVLTAMDIKNTNYNIIKANDPNDGHELWSVSLSVQFMAYQLYFDKSLNYLILDDSETICFYDIESGRIINRITDAWNFHIDSNRKIITIVKSGKKLIEYKLLTRKELIEKAANDLKDIDLSIEDKKQFLII